MEIDWFTVTAQIFNFLVLVWLLKRFLYGPILEAMDEREERIADEMQEATSLREEAEERIEEYDKKTEELEQREEDIIESAEDEARDRQKEMLEQARREVEHTAEQWYASLRREQQDVLQDVRRRTEHGLFDTIRQALSDLADADLERQIVGTFIHRLQEASDDELPTLESDEDGSRKLQVRTSVSLTGDQRERISELLRERYGDEVEPSFNVVSELIGGVEVRVDGHKFGWSMTQYLDSLEEKLDERLRERLENVESSGQEPATEDEAGDDEDDEARERAS
ncbi:MAG: F0F1 ATP synthase subunit delta [Myxococcota bacterium]